MSEAKTGLAQEGSLVRGLWTILAAALVICASIVMPSLPGLAQTGDAPASAVRPDMIDVLGIDVASRQNPAGSPLNPSTIALARIGWVRVTADWSVLEPARGKFAWTDLDAVIKQAVSAGEHILVTFVNTPQWASLSPDAPVLVWSHQPPRQVADWTAFVGAAVSRYRGRVAAWQVEPYLELSVFRGTDQDYLAMLHAARMAVRRVDPQALIVAASHAGLDLPYTKSVLSRAGDDFDVLMLYPRGRTPEEVLDALGVIRARLLTDARHQLWLSAAPDRGAQIQLAAAAFAGGVAREFWTVADPRLMTAARFLGRAKFVGPLDRGPGVYALAFTDGLSPVVVLWSTSPPHAVPLATTGHLSAIGPTGQLVPGSAGGPGPSAGPEPIFITNPAPSVVDEAKRLAQSGPFQVPREAARDFSKADSVSATLGMTNVEQGLYNQRLRSMSSGAVVPVTVDGVEAVRTDQSKDAVYVYCDVDHSYVYFVDGRYNLLITVQVHQASASQRVGFNVFYDSMSGYRFTPWQWIDAGPGWTTYTIRITDAAFSSTWGWDFAVNGAGDKKENLVVRSVAVKKVPSGIRARSSSR